MRPARQQQPAQHSKDDVIRAVSRFFAVRSLIRTRVAAGRRTDASTWLRLEVLKFIGSHDAPRVKEVAEYLSVTAPSATALVRNLVNRGLVARKADQQDRRSARLVLTRKGERTLAVATERGAAQLEGFFGALSARELERFISYLERILDAA